MSITIAPLRFIGLFILIGLAGILSGIGLIGISENDLITQPLDGWRRLLQKFLYRMGRWGFFCIGIHKLKITGEKVRNYCVINSTIYAHVMYNDSLIQCNQIEHIFDVQSTNMFKMFPDATSLSLIDMKIVFLQHSLVSTTCCISRLQYWFLIKVAFRLRNQFFIFD